MNSITRYDAHCHIFTLRYALKEVKNMLHDMLHKTYPWTKPTDSVMLTNQMNWADLKKLLREIYEVIKAALGTEEKNLVFLQSEARKAFPGDGFVIVPLMMDIYYMFAYPLDKDEDVAPTTLSDAKPVDEEEFQNSWNDILDDFTAYLQLQQNQQQTLTANIGSPQSDPIAEAIQCIEEERSVRETLVLKGTSNKSENEVDYFRTDGYCYHMDNLMELVKNREGQLLPFVAIDPRRPGIIDALLSGQFTTGKQHFYGVKLYPRMGYHPQSKPMDAVYKYCSDNNLPIIYHCGKKGFPPTDNWDSTKFGDPINFEPIVQKYPNLKIDFAHLGSSDPTFEWAKTIIDLMEKYDNVYSDLSSYTKVEKLKYIKKTFWDDDKKKKLRTRLMFGTDFDVMYLADKRTVTMQIYYDNFKNTFSSDELKILMQSNVELFLKK